MLKHISVYKASRQLKHSSVYKPWCIGCHTNNTRAQRCTLMWHNMSRNAWIHVWTRPTPHRESKMCCAWILAVFGDHVIHSVRFTVLFVVCWSSTVVKSEDASTIIGYLWHEVSRSETKMSSHSWKCCSINSSHWMQHKAWCYKYIM